MNHKRFILLAMLLVLTLLVGCGAPAQPANTPIQAAQSIQTAIIFFIVMTIPFVARKRGRLLKIL